LKELQGTLLGALHQTHACNTTTMLNIRQLRNKGKTVRYREWYSAGNSKNAVGRKSKKRSPRGLDRPSWEGVTKESLVKYEGYQPPHLKRKSLL